MGCSGGLAALPLYLQIVKGASATEAGLQLLPMTLGIMFGSGSLSGQVISRRGTYRQYPIIGAALLVAAMFAFHWRRGGHPAVEVDDHHGLLRRRPGFNFQPLTLAVQNAVSPKDIGVATSSATFTRQIGGTIGTAVFLSILFSKAAENIPARYQEAFATPAFQAAVRSPSATRTANAQFLSQPRPPRPGQGQASPGSERLLVRQAHRPRPVPSVPRRLCRGNVRGLPHRLGRPRLRAHRLVVPPARRAALERRLREEPRRARSLGRGRGATDRALSRAGVPIDKTICQWGRCSICATSTSSTSPTLRR